MVSLFLENREVLFYWTGAVFWLALCVALGIFGTVVLVGVIRGFFIACSLATFFSKCAEVNGDKPSALRFVLKVLRLWGWGILFREGESFVRGSGGEWSGYGKYSVNKVPTAERAVLMSATGMIDVQGGPRAF